MTRSVLAFAAVAALITLTPGLDTALVVRTSLAGGRRAGAVAALGVCSGLMVWGLATALGVSLLVTASSAGYTVLRACGAVWLVVLGVRAILAARSERVEPSSSTPALDHPHAAAGRAYSAGLLTNLLNPKIGVFYVTLLPQFVPAGAPVLLTTMLLAAVHAGEGVLWLGLVACFVAGMGELLRRGSVRRLMERMTGVVLVGFGLRLALERR